MELKKSKRLNEQQLNILKNGSLEKHIRFENSNWGNQWNSVVVPCDKTLFNILFTEFDIIYSWESMNSDATSKRNCNRKKFLSTIKKKNKTLKYNSQIEINSFCVAVGFK